MVSTPILFLDGGLGTSLEDEYGIQFTETTPLWSSDLLLSDPNTLKSCQRDFAQVPVDILLTATYQVSAEGFQRTKTESFPNGVSRSAIPSFLDDAVSIAEQVKRPTTMIALSLGPYGAVMTPGQEYSARYDDHHNSTDKLFCWHADRMNLFSSIPRLDTRIQFVAFETVPRLDEILAIRRLTARDALPSECSDTFGSLGRTPYWISCVFPTDQTLPDGSNVGQVIRALLSSEYSDRPPWGIGINCTKIAKLPDLVRAYRDNVKLLEDEGHLHSWPSLLLYPDGTNGEVYDMATKTWRLPTGQKAVSGESSWEKQLADVVAREQSRGCWRTIIAGGCCKASHSAISKLRAQVQRDVLRDSVTS
ncbi:Homocysteine S-methyltransferase [Xylaria sp. CBS 124048]|nr:Homocysteine S-methyltransferase [Xylaria sp. CBS 124048]